MKQIIIVFALLVLAMSSFALDGGVLATDEASVKTAPDKFRWPLESFYLSSTPPSYGLGLGLEFYTSEYDSFTLHLAGSFTHQGISGLEFQRLYNDGGYFENGWAAYRGWAVGGYKYGYLGLLLVGNGII